MRLKYGGDGIVAEWKADGSGEGRALLHHEKAFFSGEPMPAHERRGRKRGTFPLAVGHPNEP